MTVINAEQFLKENFSFIKSKSLEGCPSASIWLPDKSDIWKTYRSRIDCPWRLSFGKEKSMELIQSSPETLEICQICCLLPQW